jgi:tryptophanyl-tRNA synthetase
MGLDGLRKMSKSLGNHISMLEEPKPLWKKLAGAYTDPQRTTVTEPGRPEVCNVYRMHTALTDPARLPVIAEQCRSAEWGCGHCKKELEASLNTALAPIRERGQRAQGQPRARRSDPRRRREQGAQGRATDAARSARAHGDRGAAVRSAPRRFALSSAPRRSR